MGREGEVTRTRFTAGSVRSMGDNVGFAIRVLREGRLVGSELAQAVSIRTGAPTRCWERRRICWCGEKPHALGIRSVMSKNGLWGMHLKKQTPDCTLLTTMLFGF